MNYNYGATYGRYQFLSREMEYFQFIYIFFYHCTLVGVAPGIRSRRVVVLA